MPKRRTSVFLFLSLLAAIGAQDPKAPKPVNVSISDMTFAPGTVTVKPGGTVVWTNDDDRDHAVNAADGSFKSGNIKPGKTYRYTFKKPGSFAYGCAYHPRMKGTVTVNE